MKTFLVKEDSDWADEFGLQGFKIIGANSEEEVIEFNFQGINPRPLTFRFLKFGDPAFTIT